MVRKAIQSLLTRRKCSWYLQVNIKKREGETRKGDGIRTEADKRGINYFKLTHNGYINMELIKARKRMINGSLTNKSRKRSRI